MQNYSLFSTRLRWSIPGAAAMMAGTFAASAQQNEVAITEQDGYRHITSNGIPNHPTGSFPNRNNPNRIAPQHYSFQVPLHPEASTAPTPLGLWPFGVAVNGIPFDPGAAEFWNRDFNSGWQYEALGGGVNLGVDGSNAHVQPNGAYHYHALPSALIASLGDADAPVLIGYAADGYPIYNQYCQVNGTPEKMYASYTIKSGQRSGGPGGRHTGEFVQDYGYKPDLGNLDETNGHDTATNEYPGGTYHYHLTETFPYIPRQFHGTPDTSFMRGGPGGPNGQRGPGGQRGPRGESFRGPGGPQGGQFGPPPGGFNGPQNGRPRGQFSPPPPRGQFQDTRRSPDAPKDFQGSGAYNDAQRMPPQARPFRAAQGAQFGPPREQRFDSPQENPYPQPGRAPRGDTFEGPQTRNYGGSDPQQFRNPGDRQRGDQFAAPQDPRFGSSPGQTDGDPRQNSPHGNFGDPRSPRPGQFAGPDWIRGGQYGGFPGPPPGDRMGNSGPPRPPRPPRGAIGRPDSFGPQSRAQGRQFHRRPEGKFNRPPRGPQGFHENRPPMPGGRRQGLGQPPQGSPRGPNGSQYNRRGSRQEDSYRGPQSNPFPRP
jgi:YHYH protein